MAIYFAIGIAFLIPLAFLYFIRTRDLYATGKYRFNLVTLAWGVAAYVIAAQINPALIKLGWVTRDHVISITAPILEEFLKALILIYLVQRADFNYVVDGAVYGFGAGMGFAIIENLEYITGHPQLALAIAVARVFSTNLVHATASGVIGAALATRRADKSWLGWLFVVFGYAFSMLFHMGFNTMVSSGTFIIFAVVFGFVGVGIIYMTIKRGLNIQKTWFAENLNDLNRVTKNEVKALNTIEKFDELLKPFENQFGKDKTAMVKEMLSQQAQLGIKTKLLDTASSENQKHEIEKIIAALQSEIGLLRGKIGSYCMMFVRTVYMDTDIKIWDAINSRVAESSTGQKGGGAYDRVTQRMKPVPPQEDKP
jgi:RsiW-degrading membrane proteinase PrsW (M82 family)